MSNAYSTLVESLLPVAYYRLGESSGTTATDTSGNGRNGTYSASGVTYAASGAVVGDADTAVTFNGSTGDMAMPSSVNPAGLSALTIEFWMKLSTLSLPTSPAIIANDVVPTSNKGVVTYINSTATALNFVIGSGSAATTCTGAFTFATGTWYHICATWDGATMTLYVNGVSKGTASFAGPIASTTNNLTVGHNPAGTDFFTGSVDEVAIYNYALSATTILNHYNTALAANGTTIAYVANGQTIQANDIDQAILALQQTSGGQDAGHYYLAGAGYTNGAMDMTYVPSKSRGTTPVSVSIDTSDNSGSGYLAAPATNFLKSYGFQIYANTNGAQSNAQVGGKYTIQY